MKIIGSNIWIKYKHNKPILNYTEISFDIDLNGYPLVILKEFSKSFFLKLTESMIYAGFEPTKIISVNHAGVWKKKKITKSKLKAFFYMKLP